MSLCSVCGGKVSPEHRTCPYCGQENPAYGLPDLGLASDWNLLEDEAPTQATPTHKPFDFNGEAPTAPLDFPDLDDEATLRLEPLAPNEPAPPPALFDF